MQILTSVYLANKEKTMENISKRRAKTKTSEKYSSKKKKETNKSKPARGVSKVPNPLFSIPGKGRYR